MSIAHTWFGRVIASPRSRPPQQAETSGALSPGAAIGSIKRTVSLPSRFLAAPKGSRGRYRSMRPPSRCAASRCLWAPMPFARGSRTIIIMEISGFAVTSPVQSGQSGQSAPVSTTTPSHKSRTARVNVGGLDRRVELHRIAALLARPIARALAAAERHVIVDAGRR